MFGAFERLIGLRYLRARRQEGFVSVITGFSLVGILLGVAVLIVVMAVMNGFRAELLSRILGLNGHMNLHAPTGLVVGYDTLAEQLAQVPGIRSATPQVEAQALYTHQGQANGVVVRGMAGADFSARMDPKLYFASRRDQQLTILQEGGIEGYEAGGIAIGTALAARLGLRVGDSLTIISPMMNYSALGPRPRLKTYKVALIFEFGMYEYDSSFIFMNLAEAQKLFALPDGVTSISLMTADPDSVGEMLPSLRATFPDQTFDSWRDRNQSFFSALEVERNVMFLILTLIILVAAFNIISGMIMLVKDKGRDIAILRTMGATRGMILRAFFLAGAVIGLLGTGLGVAAGVAFAANIQAIQHWLDHTFDLDLWPATVRFLTEIPAVMDWGQVAAIVTMSVLLTLAASLYPAWRAARLDPVEALRYE